MVWNISSQVHEKKNNMKEEIETSFILTRNKHTNQNQKKTPVRKSR